MVTFVVASFLPYSVDFHEFDDVGHGGLRRIASSRNQSGADLRKMMTVSRDPSSSDLARLGKQQFSEISFSAYVGNERVSHSPSYHKAEPTAVAESADLARNVSRLTFWEQHSDVPTHTPKAEFGRWLRTEMHDGPSIESEVLDQATAPRMDSIVSAKLATMMDTPGHLVNHHNPNHTPGHSRKSSLNITPSKIELQRYLDFDYANWTVEPAIIGNGGLVNAIRKSTSGKATQTIWIGALSAVEADRLPPGRKEEIASLFANEYESHVIFVSDSDMSGHYDHFCKIILWPVLHYHMPDNPKAKAYEEKSWKYYVKVNQMYADEVTNSYKHGDTIWVQDYHLMLVPQMVRARIPDAKIGFFLHTGFPSPEIWRCVSSRVELLHGMLGANICGFQTAEYARHFRQTCTRMLVTEVTNDGVFWEDRFIKVISQPIGIVSEAIDEVMELQGDRIAKEISDIERRYAGKTLIVARDKMDNVRGIRQKLLAYEYFLEMNPEAYKTVVLMQIATSTSELIELQTSIHDIVWRINERFADILNNPIELLLSDIPFERYLAMISVADVLMVTTLREGMGLTAQEFVYCQDGKLSHKKHGQVILSEFCGTSYVFDGNDLSCNPWHTHQMAMQIQAAIDMSAEEKTSRWTKLRAIVEDNTGGDWWAALQETLNQYSVQQSARLPANVPRLDTKKLIDNYASSNKRLLILDVEDALCSTSSLPEHRTHVESLLQDLTSDSKNLVYISSGRSPSNLDEMYCNVPKLGLIAENGSFIHFADAGAGKWVPATAPKQTKAWKTAVLPFLKYYRARLDNTELIESCSSFTLSYAKTTILPDPASAIVGDLVIHVNETCKPYRLEAVPHLPSSEKKITISPSYASKSIAVTTMFAHALRTLPKDTHFDFILVAGDGRDTEEVFKWARDLRARENAIKDWRWNEEDKMVAYTVALANQGGMTEAESTLSGGAGAMVNVLKKLVKGAEEVRRVNRRQAKREGNWDGYRAAGGSAEDSDEDEAGEDEGLTMKLSRCRSGGIEVPE